MVIKKINDLVYWIQLGPGLKSKLVHRNQLWKYSGRNPPAWHNQVSGMEERQTLPKDGSDPPEVIEEEPDTEDENSITDGNAEQLQRSTRTHCPPARYEASI